MARIDHVSKTFEFDQAEAQLYQRWEAAGYFTGKVDPAKKPFCIVMPPPNITGQLHMGHALDNTLQDILTRWHRMQGEAVLWQPGTDHASIATEAKIVDSLKQEGLSKADLGREAFLTRAWAWKKTYGDRIVSQLQRLGCSCDWDRQRFTMDEGLSRAVQTVFMDLYHKGLIYRGERIINWCPSCLTSISDIEVVYEDQASFLWHLRYPLVEKPGYLVLATTRPETLLGDTAVAVNPEDGRYQDLAGCHVRLPLTDRVIPIIQDSYVDPDFGTGVVKITPAHDPNDYEVGLRHQLPLINVMTDDAHIVPGFDRYSGMSREEARKAVVSDLQKQDLIEKIEPYQHHVGTCQRCGTTVEPRCSKQWFVKMEPLAKPAIEAVKTGQIKFVPERFSKTYFNWMDHIKDWCISRQLWWGHRIPAYYCQDCGETVIAASQPDTCPQCGGHSFKQDPDTLDTWFSSALWPFSTLGWPDQTPELGYYYPTDVLVTGYDIIFFWVARMIFSGLEQTGQVPFRKVLMHGIVRDAEGRKMSKSLGNGIDPLEIIDQYGADALRFALINGTAPGNDQRYQPQLLESGRAFINKMWNAYRFVVMNLPDELDFSQVNPQAFQLEDRWILSRLNQVTEEINLNLEKFEFGVALAKIYNFIWEEFCDWYLEMVKPRLYGDLPAGPLEARFVLCTVLRRAMQLLHPIMPFVTETIYSDLPATSLSQAAESIMLSDWPDSHPEWQDRASEQLMDLIMSATRQIRNIRLNLNVKPSRKADLIVVTDNPALSALFAQSRPYLDRLAQVSSVSTQKDKTGISVHAVTAVVPGAELYLPLEQLVDLAQEKQRLQAELEKNAAEIDRLGQKLANESFVSRAPAAVVDKEREKLEQARQVRLTLQDRLKAYSEP
ncbi:valine--tRNA ligase [Oscillospiraceae bacterium HV4-5-C5C]|nr:valine--tRNA ligase [Oscillospiraceae bacterium HV4-5-C5C]